MIVLYDIIYAKQLQDFLQTCKFCIELPSVSRVSDTINEKA